MEPDALGKFLATSLPRYTSRTIVDPAKLSSELNKVRKQGWASDSGDHGSSVAAVAAPVAPPSGQVNAALGIPYLAEDKEDEDRDRLRAMGIQPTAKEPN